MSVRDGAKTGMQPLDVAQSGAALVQGAGTTDRTACCPYVLQIQGPTSSIQTDATIAFDRESCTSVLRQAVRARVVDVQCYSTVHARPASGQQRSHRSTHCCLLAAGWYRAARLDGDATVLFAARIGPPGSGRGRDWCNIETVAARLTPLAAASAACCRCRCRRAHLGHAINCVITPRDAHKVPTLTSFACWPGTRQ